LIGHVADYAAGLLYLSPEALSLNLHCFEPYNCNP
jgi:hypothetical protein